MDADPREGGRAASQRLSMGIEAMARRAGWSAMQESVIRAAVRDSNLHRIAAERGANVNTLRKHASRAAAKAGKTGLLDLVGSILLEAAIGDLDVRLLVIATRSPAGARGLVRRAHRHARDIEPILRVERAIAEVARTDGMTRCEMRVLGGGVALAGFDRAAIAELLDSTLNTFDCHSSFICVKHGATRVTHVVHDVLRLACGLELSPHQRWVCAWVEHPRGGGGGGALMTGSDGLRSSHPWPKINSD